jgi:hypothetical protein
MLMRHSQPYFRVSIHILRATVYRVIHYQYANQKTKVELGTALHASKDLAVSPLLLPKGLIQPYFCNTKSASYRENCYSHRKSRAGYCYLSTHSVSARTS